MRLYHLLDLAVYLVAVVRCSRESETAHPSGTHYFMQNNQDGYLFRYMAPRQAADTVRSSATNAPGKYMYEDPASQTQQSNTAESGSSSPMIVTGAQREGGQPNEQTFASQPITNGAYNVNIGNFRQGGSINHEDSLKQEFDYNGNAQADEESDILTQNQHEIGYTQNYKLNSNVKTGSTASSDTSPVTYDNLMEETHQNVNYNGGHNYVKKDEPPFTIEYKAGPKMGFIYNSYINDKMGLDQHPNIGMNTKSSVNLFTPASKLSVKTTDHSVHSPMAPSENVIVLPKYEPKVNRRSFLDDHSIQPFVTIKSPSADAQKHYQELILAREEDKKIKMEPREEENASFDASYRFGFSAENQTRNEEADAQGNVQGSYSYLGDDGFLRKVDYEAGAKTGFRIKKVTLQRAQTSETPHQHGHIKNHSHLRLNTKGKKSTPEIHNKQKAHSPVTDKNSTESNFQEDEPDVENTDTDNSYFYNYYNPEQLRDEPVDTSDNTQETYSSIVPVNEKGKKTFYEINSGPGFLVKDSHFQLDHALVESPKYHEHDIDGTTRINNDGSYSFTPSTAQQLGTESADSNIGGMHLFTPHNENRIKVNYKTNTEHGSIPKDLHMLSVQAPYETSTHSTPDMNIATNINNDGSYSFSYETFDQPKINILHKPFTHNLNERVGLPTNVEESTIKHSTKDKDSIVSDNIFYTPDIKNYGSYLYSYIPSDESRKEIFDTTQHVKEQPFYISNDARKLQTNYNAGSKDGMTAEESLTKLATNIKTNTRFVESSSPDMFDMKENDTLSNDNTTDLLKKGTEDKLNDGSYSQFYKLVNYDDDDETNYESLMEEGADETGRKETYSKSSEILLNPLLTSPSVPQVILDIPSIRRAVPMKNKGQKNMHKRKKTVTKRPLKSPVNQNFTKILPDGSYQFSYETNDHSRQESIDSEGNLNSSYQFKSKNDGKTVVIFIRKAIKVPATHLLNAEDQNSEDTATTMFKSTHILAQNPTDDSYLTYITPNHVKKQQSNRRRQTKESQPYNIINGMNSRNDDRTGSEISNDSLNQYPPVLALTKLHDSEFSSSETNDNSMNDKYIHDFKESKNVNSDTVQQVVPEETSLKKQFRGNTKYKMTGRNDHLSGSGYLYDY